VEITGSTNGSVWGNGVYTTGCSLSTAAVHSGALRAGEKGLVTVTILPGQESYEAATRNGVTSQAWGEWKSSFVVQKTVPAGHGDPAMEDLELRVRVRDLTEREANLEKQPPRSEVNK
jgi:hypothetical protein